MMDTKPTLLDEDLYLEMLAMPRGTKDLQELFIRTYLNDTRFKRDDYGNLYMNIIKDTYVFSEWPDTAFMCHIDTVHRPNLTEVPVYAQQGTAYTDNTVNCLGADCTTGIFIMLNMIENQVPGLYCFFLDEEVGGLGSQWAAENLNWGEYNHAISFDRYGTQSIITHQMGERTASEEFAEELSERFFEEGLDYEGDDSGVFTDSYSFGGVIHNRTNLSVGYYNQHTNSETQDLNFLLELCNAVCTISWTNLPLGNIEPDYEPDYSDFFHDDFGTGFPLVDDLLDLLNYHADEPIADDIERDLEFILQEYSNLDENDPFHIGKN